MSTTAQEEVMYKGENNLVTISLFSPGLYLT